MDVFIDYLRNNTDLDEAEIRHAIAYAMPQKLRRNDVLFQAGDVCRHKIFVESGLLRLYGLSQDGGEHILYFGPENSWILDAESYDLQTPSRYNIDAVEPSELVIWSKTDFERLLAELPALKVFSQRLIARNIYGTRARLLSAIGGTPEEKYEDFVRLYPGLLNRLPLRMIAAYLGVSIKTLTRLRHAQLTR